MINIIDDAKGRLYRHSDLYLMVEDSEKWVTFGHLDATSSLTIDDYEWDAFVALVKKVDEDRMERKA